MRYYQEMTVINEIFYSIILIDIGVARYWSQDYNEVRQQCSNSADCYEGLGQYCYWLYEGCFYGQCMCNPIRDIQNDDGRCMSVKYGGESCGKKEICKQNMVCRNGVCGCYNGNLTSDGQFCLTRRHRLLGQRCDPTTNICVHKASSGYTTQEVTCSSEGVCVCEDGYKKDGIGCRRWEINERGCYKSYQCSGGAICMDEICVCPAGYRVVAMGSKCAKSGAVTDIPKGDLCDEVNERRYCAQGLVCHRCPGEGSSKCVRFAISGHYEYLRSSITSTRTLCYYLLIVVFAFLLGSVR